MPVDPLLLYAYASDVLACARAEVAASGGGVGDGMRVCVTPAPVAEDGCCDGQLSAAVVRAYRSTTFPLPEGGAQPCGHAETVIEVQVVVLRCAPLAADVTSPPPCEGVGSLDEAARLVLRDAYAVRRAIECCLPMRHRALGETRFIHDACVGSDTRVLIGLEDGCACGDGP
jgi:hypothetical protein